MRSYKLKLHLFSQIIHIREVLRYSIALCNSVILDSPEWIYIFRIKTRLRKYMSRSLKSTTFI